MQKSVRLLHEVNFNQKYKIVGRCSRCECAFGERSRNESSPAIENAFVLIEDGLIKAFW